MLWNEYPTAYTAIKQGWSSRSAPTTSRLRLVLPSLNKHKRPFPGGPGVRG